MVIANIVNPPHYLLDLESNCMFIGNIVRMFLAVCLVKVQCS